MWSPLPSSHTASTQNAVLASWGQVRGEGQGRGGGACHGHREKVGQRRDEEWVLYAQVPVTVTLSTSNPGWRENRSVSSFYLTP